jgi:hypothetical protein
MKWFFLAISLVSVVTSVAWAQTPQNSDVSVLQKLLSEVDDLKKEIATLKSQAISIPAGAVVAFDSRDGCPPGWTAFDTASGRTIIGARRSSNESDDNIIKRRDYAQFGGQPTFQLHTENLPPFSLTFFFRTDLDEGEKPAPMVRAITANKGEEGANHPVTMNFAVPHQQPVDIIMPYVALFYCRKS